MKFNKFKILFLVGLLLPFTFSCEDDSVVTDNPINSINYVSFEPNKKVYLASGETTDTEVKVFISKPSSTDVVIPIVVDVAANAVDGDPGSTLPASNYSVPSSVTIPAGSTEASFLISDIVADGADKTIIIGFEPVEGIDYSTTYTSTTNNVTGVTTYTSRTREITVVVSEICGLNPFRIEIVIDRYGEETSWELYNAADLDNPIASGGPYTRQSANGSFPQAPVNLCLASGDYVFVIYDSEEDGMDSGYGEGYYRLVKMDPYGEEVEEIAKNGTFGAFDVVEFSFP